MAYIIADPCVSTCDTACVEVCPVDCIHGPDDKEGAGAEAKETGFDPVFYVPHLEKTFAELSTNEKNKISHRGIALQKLRKILVNVLN